MIKISLYNKELYSDQLYLYPCKDPNSKHLERRTVAIFDNFSIVRPEWFSKYGAEVLINPSDEGFEKAKIAVVMPNYGQGYYEVLDYYIAILQRLVKSMKTKHNYKHIVVVLPPKSDEFSTKESSMAHYSVYGLIKGLGKTYAVNNLFVNGIMLNENDPLCNLQEFLVYLSSDNSCNTIGQIIKL